VSRAEISIIEARRRRRSGQGTSVELVSRASGVGHTGSTNKGTRVGHGNVRVWTPGALESQHVSDTGGTVDSRNGGDVSFTSWRRWRRDTLIHRGSTTLAIRDTGSNFQGSGRRLGGDVLWTPGTLNSKEISETARAVVGSIVSRGHDLLASWRRCDWNRVHSWGWNWRSNWGWNWWRRNWGWNWRSNWRRNWWRRWWETTVGSVSRATWSVEDRASTSSNLIATLTITTAIVRTRNDSSDTAASNNVTFTIGVVESWDESTRSLVWSLVQLDTWDLQETVSRIGIGWETEPSPSTIVRDGIGVTNVTISSRETSRASLSRNETGLTDITTDFGGISIVDQELKTVGMGRNQTQSIEIPGYFDTIDFNVRDLANSGRIDKTNWWRIRTLTQIPERTTRTRSVKIGGGEDSGGRNDGKDPGTIRLSTCDGLC
jgi:hypothetical protein